MSASRLAYRTRQFWQAISTSSSQEDMELAAEILTPSQLELFQQLHRSEQNHSLRVLKELRSQGEDNIDLQAAALLHDIGKTKVPLRLWERVLVVIARAICPGCVKKWGAAGENDPLEELGWRRAFVVAEMHPVWGAELVSQSGASELAAALVARHQEQLPANGEKTDSIEDRLLSKLQAVDNQS
jgi:predicted hydrolase (HD superfamily)